MNVVCPVNVSTQPEHTLPDIQSTQHAVKFIEKLSNESQPFFLALGYHKPHIPFKFPQEYLSRYYINNVKNQSTCSYELTGVDFIDYLN